jgi:hypothetical protein
MNELECDITELLGAFSELLPLSDEETGHYWFRHNREDGFSIILILSIYESTVGLLLKMEEADVTSLSFSRCRCVRLGGRSKDTRIIEILGSVGNPAAYCAVRLHGDPIVHFEDRELVGVPFPISTPPGRPCAEGTGKGTGTFIIDGRAPTRGSSDE